MHFLLQLSIFCVAGLKSFLSDAKEYWSVRTGVNSGIALHKFTPKELESYRKMPSDMVRLIPVLAVSLLPMGYLILIPV